MGALSLGLGILGVLSGSGLLIATLALRSLHKRVRQAEVFIGMVALKNINLAKSIEELKGQDNAKSKKN